MAHRIFGLIPFLQLAFLTIVIRPTHCVAQVPAIIWQHKYGGGDAETFADIQPTRDGGFVSLGTTSSIGGDVSVIYGGGDFWLVKTDNTGNLVWENSYGGSGTDNANSIKQTNDGGYILAGLTTSSDINVSGQHGSGDAWIVKIDSLGHLVWQKCLGGSASDRATDIQLTSDGGYIVAGYTNSVDGDVTGFHGGVGEDYWIVKLNDTGGIDWQRAYGGDKMDIAYSIRQTSDGGYIAAGYASSDNGDITLNKGGTDAWILKLNGTGGIVWQKMFGGTGLDFATSIQQTTDGGFIVSGQTLSNDGDVSVNRGYFDAWVFKLDDTGGIVWQKTYGGSGEDNAQRVQQTLDGGYIFAGWTGSNNGDVIGKHDTIDYWVVKLTATGTIDWQKCLGGSLRDYGVTTTQGVDGSFVVAGNSNSADGDAISSYGGQDFWLVKLGAANGVPSTGEKAINIYPTVTAGEIQIDLPENYGNSIVTVTNLLSQNIKITAAGGVHRVIQIDPDALTGIYVLHVQNSSESISCKIILER